MPDPGAPDSDGAEVEWQFEAPDLKRVERWLRRGAGGGVRALDTGEQVDVYLDTPDWRFIRANRSLRLREGADRVEATLKSLDEQADGPRSRREVTQALPAPTTEALLAAAGEVSTSVRAVAASEPLLERGRVRTERANFEVTAGRPRKPVATLSLDRTFFDGSDDTGAGPALLRVEVEVLPGVAPDEVADFVERLAAACDLMRAQGSKFDHALRHANVTPTVEPVPPPPSKDATLGEVATAAVAAQLYALHKHEPAARLGEDPEGVHDLRVATRRLRAALGILGDAFSGDLDVPSAELRWIAADLGGVRDLDVLLDELGRWEAAGPPTRAEALAPLLIILQSRRDAARGEMLLALNSQRYAALCADLRALLDDSCLAPGAADDGRARAAVVLRAAHRKFRRDAGRATIEAPASAWHQLRIRGKRLRYAIEFFAPVLGRPAERALTTLKQAQDLLGELQDAAVASANLGAIVERELVPPRTAFAVGEWAGAREADARALRSKLPRILDEFAADWQRLRAVLPDAAARPRQR
jgi:CHAD domain-containing protein